MFHPIGPTGEGKFKTHEVKIAINELGEDLEGYYPIVTKKCTCKSFQIQKKDCKHIIDALTILKARGVNLKDELQTEATSEPKA